MGNVQLVVKLENPERYEVVPLELTAAPAPAAPVAAASAVAQGR